MSYGSFLKIPLMHSSCTTTVSWHGLKGQLCYDNCWYNKSRSIWTQEPNQKYSVVPRQRPESGGATGFSSCVTAPSSNSICCTLQVERPHYCFSKNQTFLRVTVRLLFEREQRWLSCCFVEPANKPWGKTLLVLSDGRRATSYQKSGSSLAHSNFFPLLNNHLPHMLLLLLFHQLFWQIF